MLRLEDLIDSFASAQTHEDTWGEAVSSIGSVGGTAINVVSYNKLTYELNWIRSSMRQAWLEDYTSQGFSSCDPFLNLITSTNIEETVASGSVERSEATSSLAYELNHQAFDAGHRSLVGMKTSGAFQNEGRLIVIASENKPGDFLGAESMVSLRRYAAVAGGFLKPPTSASNSDLISLVGTRLSNREAEALTLLSIGNRNDAIAHKMGVTEVTVRKHMASARQKLGATTREQALTKAIYQGQIQP